MLYSRADLCQSVEAVGCSMQGNCQPMQVVNMSLSACSVTLLLQVLDAVSGALIGAFTWWNLGFVAPALAYVYKRKLPVSPFMQ